MKLRCLFGHDWRLAKVEVFEGSGYTDSPMDYVIGGEDWLIECKRCAKQRWEHKRGAWLPSAYKALEQP